MLILFNNILHVHMFVGKSPAATATLASFVFSIQVEYVDCIFYLSGGGDNIFDWLHNGVSKHNAENF